MSDDPHIDRLLLTARESALMLSISERLLWKLTALKEVPCVRIGRAVRYDRRDLIAWIDRRKGVGTAPPA